MRRTASALAVVASLVAAVVAPAAAPPVSSAPATAHVTYVAATSAYVDAGQDEGLAEGDELEVVRDGGVIATLKVTYVSTHRVSCAIVASVIGMKG